LFSDPWVELPMRARPRMILITSPAFGFGLGTRPIPVSVQRLLAWSREP
jgi:hypothetical protein